MTDQIQPGNLPQIDVGKIYEQKKKGMLEGSSGVSNGEFKNLLKGFIQEVNSLELQAEEKIEKLATGEIKDLHEVMVAATEAETSFKIMMEMRNKLLNAYNEIMKMK